MVGRSTMGDVRLLQHIAYQSVSGWEILAYGLLGVLCGLVSFAFVRLLHGVEDFCKGKRPGALSKRLGQMPLAFKAGLGGLCAGGRLRLR